MIEDCIFIALDLDTEAKALKAGFDAQQASLRTGKFHVGVDCIPSKVDLDEDSHTGETEDLTSDGSVDSSTFDWSCDEDDFEKEEQEL